MIIAIILELIANTDLVSLPHPWNNHYYFFFEIQKIVLKMTPLFSWLLLPLIKNTDGFHNIFFWILSKIEEILIQKNNENKVISYILTNMKGLLVFCWIFLQEYFLMFSHILHWYNIGCISIMSSLHQGNARNLLGLKSTDTLVLF